MRFANSTRVLLGLCAALSYGGLALAQAPAPTTSLAAGQVGLIYYSSITPTQVPQITRRQPGAPVTTVQGTLAFPPGATGPVPAMVISHTCGGVSPQQTRVAQVLNQIGIATFIVDSFTPRGIIGGTCTNGALLSITANIADALYALNLLATHPRIDSSRIGVLGQSLGGQVAYGTSFEEFRQGIIDGPLKFATHVSQYPSGCEYRWWSPNMTRVPMLTQLAQLDDWTPAAPCMNFDLQLRALGAPITTIVYPNAQHAWDSGLVALDYSAQRGHTENCYPQLRLDTLQLSRYDTGEVLTTSSLNTYFSACRTFGASMQGSAATVAAADSDLKIFLAKTFGLTGITLPASQPDRIFNFGEATYPALFAPAGSASQSVAGYYYRYYSQTNSYLATKGGKLYYYAPGQNPNILEVGAEAGFLAVAGQAGY